MQVPEGLPSQLSTVPGMPQISHAPFPVLCALVLAALQDLLGKETLIFNIFLSWNGCSLDFYTQDPLCIHLKLCRLGNWNQEAQKSHCYPSFSPRLPFPLTHLLSEALPVIPFPFLGGPAALLQLAHFPP